MFVQSIMALGLNWPRPCGNMFDVGKQKYLFLSETTRPRALILGT